MLTSRLCSQTARRVRRFRRSTPAAVAGLLAVVVLTALPSPVRAAPYEVWSCRDAAGAPISAAAWFPHYEFLSAGNAQTAETCASGGGFRMALRSDLAHNTVSSAELWFDVPRGTTISDYTLWRSGAVDPAVSGFVGMGGEESLAGNRTDYLECDNLVDPADCNTDAGNPLAVANRFTMQSATPLDALKLYARCLNPTCGPAVTPGADLASVTLHRSVVTLDDPTAPTATVTGGTLTSGTAVTGLGTLSVATQDRESGVASVSLSLDGGPATTVPSGTSLNGCHLPYSDPRPCPTDLERLFLIDADALDPGSHEATGTVVDAAGNTTPWGPVAFTVAEPTVPAPPLPPTPPAPPLPPPPTPPAVSGGTPSNGTPAVLTPRVRLKRAPARAGRPHRVSGTVTTASGTPIRGARLTVTRQPLGVFRSAKPATRTVTTDARGRFVVPRFPAGAYRVTTTFSPWPGAPATRSIAQRVSSKLRLSTSATPRKLRRGQRVTLRGRLRGAGPATRRTPVEIQAIVRGRWQPVGSARATASGRWSWRYRFVNVTQPTRFAFRAVVTSTPAWPWATRSSPRVHVRVDPR